MSAKARYSAFLDQTVPERRPLSGYCLTLFGRHRAALLCSGWTRAEMGSRFVVAWDTFLAISSPTTT